MKVKNFFLCFLIILMAFLNLQAQNPILTPQQFLGYELGQQFTYHHRVIDYYEYITQNSNKANLVVYGQTNERRPLVTAIISSPDNIKNLESIRRNNLIVAGMEEGNIPNDLKTIVWLSYNIHGDEAAGTEAAIKTIHHLVTDKNAEKWLEETIIILDPCENPDGRDRYTNWYNRVVNATPSSDINSMEHRQPWPGGRYNHYLFDLNRDWAWQSQIESQHRAKLYHKWMPHVHIDLHEMGFNSPYFFSPAAKPFHEVITEWQREFQDRLGKNNAKHFDENGWLYYTQEIFDLLYPSYGDTWPTFNGAIGLTYEKGGSGRAGLVVKQQTGNFVTLSDRLTHHFSTSLSTIEAAYLNREKMIEEFKKYFAERVSDKYKAYVVKYSATHNDRIEALLKLLDNQKIQYGHPNTQGSYSGFDFLKNKNGQFSLQENDIVIRLDQPLSRFVKVLFEPKTMVEDSLTYDLTAWSIPYIYELESYAVEKDIANKKISATQFQPTELPIRAPYAVVVEYNDIKDAKILGELLQNNLVVRFAERPFKVDGKSFERGSLIVTKGDNSGRYLRFDKEVLQITNENQKAVTLVGTGLSDAGYDLGSNHMRYIKPVKVALLGGDGISPLAYGEAWHFFEQVLKYPLVTLHTSYFSSVKLSNYDVIVLPSGSYFKYNKKLMDFVSQGGKVIALDRAASSLARNSSSSFNTKKSASKESNNEPIKYADQDRASASRLVAGSIYRIELDETHPLAFGFDNSIHIMKRNSTVFEPLNGNGWTVGRFKEDAHISGFVGNNLKVDLKNSAALVVENHGSGQIIYMPDSPIFRGFWHSGKLLFSNALFLVGQ